MQILVVVASIQMRTLKTEVEKGFMRTLIDHELAGPKAQSNFVLKEVAYLRVQEATVGRKGIRLIFLSVL